MPLLIQDNSHFVMVPLKGSDSAGIRKRESKSVVVGLHSIGKLDNGYVSASIRHQQNNHSKCTHNHVLNACLPTLSKFVNKMLRIHTGKVHLGVVNQVCQNAGPFLVARNHDTRFINTSLERHGV